MDLNQIRQAQVTAAEDLIVNDLKAKGLVTDDEIPNRAPRVTPADLDAEIASAHYFTAEDGARMAGEKAADGSDIGLPEALELLTFCVLVLKNGYTVVGQSACASAENFDAEIGRRLALSDAKGKLWPLLGFRLRDRLHALQFVSDDELRGNTGG